MRRRSGVQAVADGRVDEPVLAADRDGRLRARQGERKQARALSAAENDAEDVVHAGQLRSKHRA